MIILNHWYYNNKINMTKILGIGYSNFIFTYSVEFTCFSNTEVTYS